MKVRQLTKQTLKQHSEALADDTVQAGVETTAATPNDVPEAAVGLPSRAMLESHTPLVRQSTLERQRTFESQGTTIDGRTSASSTSKVLFSTSRASTQSHGGFTKAQDRNSEECGTAFVSGTSVNNTPSLTHDSAGMTSSSVQSQSPLSGRCNLRSMSQTPLPPATTLGRAKTAFLQTEACLQA